MSHAYALSRYYREKNQAVVVVCEHLDEAEALYQDCCFFLGSSQVALLRDWETLPYDDCSPPGAVTAERLQTLYQLPHAQKITVMALSTYLTKVPPAAFIFEQNMLLKLDESYDREAFIGLLTELGYEHVNLVTEHGQFACRGSLIDLYLSSSVSPLRIDWMGDTIVSIKRFDPVSQRSFAQQSQVHMMSAHEHVVNEHTLAGFKSRWASFFASSVHSTDILAQLQSRGTFAGSQYYLPLLHEHVEHVRAYFPAGTRVLTTISDLKSASDAFWQQVNHRYQLLQDQRALPLLPPEALFVKADTLEVIEPTAHKINFPDNVAALPEWIAQHPGYRLLVAMVSPRRLQQLQALLPECVLIDEITPWITGDTPLACIAQKLSQHLVVDERTVILSEQVLYGNTASYSLATASSPQHKVSHAHLRIQQLNELHHGDLVTHEKHGLGRYTGLKTMDINGYDKDFIELVYHDDAKLFIPIEAMHEVMRYLGTDDQVTLSRLGSKKWQDKKRKLAQQVHDLAITMMQTHIEREQLDKQRYKEDMSAYAQFSQQFPHELTADQEQAVNDILTDLFSVKKMDRLLCGDVGFGKTEVAMRAAFIAAYSGKQVMVLVPTTVLAQQHYQCFQERFSPWPIKIGLLRSASSACHRQVKAGCASGDIDIVIGTHALLQPSLKMKTLSLLIIDEEHRFGVKHKETVKERFPHVDLIAMSATPIPRTLNMALSKIRDVSLMTTPPKDRVHIQTFVKPCADSMIHEAISRELHRGGQVYFVYNDIDSMAAMEKKLQRLLPQCRIGCTHGRLSGQQLDRVMQAFQDHAFDILLTTTIIESGIDISNANTIIMYQADRFGLAQLHQLRGRVGRSQRQGYAYLLVHHFEDLTTDAQRRLLALQQHSELGGGLNLAIQDMEIRGVGHMFGKQQSGDIIQIGYLEYQKIVADTLAKLSGDQPSLETAPRDINLNRPMILPEAYIEDMATRLDFYRQLSTCSSLATLSELSDELSDRFGTLPKSTENLRAYHRLRIMLHDSPLQSLSVGQQYLYILLVEPTQGRRLMSSSTLPGIEDVRLDAQKGIGFKIQGIEDSANIVRFVEAILSALQPNA